MDLSWLSKNWYEHLLFFLGYELPNSTGQTGTIVDGLEEGMGGVSDSVGDINSGLDETNKKLKEAVGSLASFDKLNVIKPPTDTGSSGGGGAGGFRRNDC